MASGCLVLVDGWNHFLQAQSCFGYEVAVKFPLDRLASHVATVVGEDTVIDVAVVMAIPDRNQPGEEPEFWAWRKKLNKLSNYGVRYERAKFAYHDMHCAGCGNPLDRKVTCPHCERENPLPGRRKEKGADVKLATLALNAAWRQDHSSLVILAQDADYGPLARQVKVVYAQQDRRCTMYSAFPKCGAATHAHRGVPDTQWLPIDEEDYAKLIALPYANPRR
jgi:NYN domain